MELLSTSGIYPEITLCQEIRLYLTCQTSLEVTEWGFFNVLLPVFTMEHLYGIWDSFA